MQRFMSVLMVIGTAMAVMSIVIAVISRLAQTMVIGLTPSAYLRFTDTCLLFAITFALFLLVFGKREGNR
jgi:hypothetical protein